MGGPGPDSQSSFFTSCSSSSLGSGGFGRTEGESRMVDLVQTQTLKDTFSIQTGFGVTKHQLLFKLGLSGETGSAGGLVTESLMRAFSADARPQRALLDKTSITTTDFTLQPFLHKTN